MTKQQNQKSFEDLEKLICVAQKATEEAGIKISNLEKKIDAKILPINLEQDISNSVQKSIAESIKNVLTGYQSPLNQLVAGVINENCTFLRSIISDSFNQVIRTEDFKQSIVDAFSHKVARSIISNNEGLFDKVSNDLKQDAVFKAKMAMAVANVVEECLKGK